MCSLSLSANPETHESKLYGLSSSLRAGRLEASEEPIFQSKSQVWKRPISQLKQSGTKSSLLLGPFVPFRSSND